MHVIHSHYLALIDTLPFMQKKNENNMVYLTNVGACILLNIVGLFTKIKISKKD